MGCSSAAHAPQVSELLAFLGTADPIAERERLIDETLQQLGEDFDLAEDELRQLCEEEGIPLVLGVQTCISCEDYSALLNAVRVRTASR